jgi:hypothetical protein
MILTSSFGNSGAKAPLLKVEASFKEILGFPLISDFLVFSGEGLNFPKEIILPAANLTDKCFLFISILPS